MAEYTRRRIFHIFRPPSLFPRAVLFLTDTGFLVYQAVEASENPSTSFVLSVSSYTMETAVPFALCTCREWGVKHMPIRNFAVCVLRQRVFYVCHLY